MEEITTRDESSNICPAGQRVLPSGGVSADGPPTTLSGTGIDRMAFLQANITRDNTKFVNGAIVGERNVFQLDQGLFIGSKFPFFNHHRLTWTKFLQLKTVEEGAGNPPPPVISCWQRRSRAFPRKWAKMGNNEIRINNHIGH
ncbi:protein TOC75-3, chloroplastic-like [Apium graveolens]|uniref:protein TOC75-3, chloroplastic-like n=1 Tax=Apium graveolens TaxID=4045 RepID=UPI003D7BCB26